jgi:uncharacterized membrane protein YfcA
MDAKLDCSGNRGTHCPAGGRISGDGLRGDVNYAPVGGGDLAGARLGERTHRGDGDLCDVGRLALAIRQRGLVQDRMACRTWGHGAFLGAVVLASVITAEAAEPIVAVFLFGLGIFILARFSFRRHERPVRERPIPRAFIGPLGFVAGFLDAAGGGGWGPISTPTLLSSGRMQPRKVIGTVDTSEFVVALAASLGFLISLSFANIPWQLVGALLVGGLIAAPIAAWIVRILPARIMGTAVGGFILIVNMKTFLEAIGVGGGLALLIYVLIVMVWVAALAHSIMVNRQEKRTVAESQPA